MPSLAFEPPRLIAEHAGVWMDGVQGLSATHALGAVNARSTFQFVATTDAGRTWSTRPFGELAPQPGRGRRTFASGRAWQNDTWTMGGIRDSSGSIHNLGNLTTAVGTSRRNITAAAAPACAVFSVSGAGHFVKHARGPPVAFAGIPGVERFLPSAGATLALPGGRFVGTLVCVMADDRISGRRSVLAFVSADGFSWRWTSVVAAAAQLPRVAEGPSENALAALRNGSVLCVMRVEGQSGHHSPYRSAVSDDGGESWHSLCALPDGVGSVRPRLLPVGGSLVLSGGRAGPESRDCLVWLNTAADGEAWEPYSLSYWHNAGLGTDSPWRFAAAAVNASRALPRFSTCYTSLVSTGARSGFVVYGGGSRAFAMRFRLKHPTRREYAAATTAAAAAESSGHQKRVTHPDNS